jgi:parallel beta-helix repeat protein
VPSDIYSAKHEARWLRVTIMQTHRTWAIGVIAGVFAGCGGGGGGSSTPSIQSVTVATNPSGMSSVNPAGVVQLVATVAGTGNPNSTVAWAVNGVPNGNSMVGTITAIGTDAALYTAPVTAPNPASVTITATCVADSSKSAILVEAIQSCTLNGTIGYMPPAAYAPPSGSTCDVSDVSTLETCVAAVRSGSTTNVRFTATVNCSGNETCLVDVTNVHGPVTFFGAPGVSSGFLRTDTYTYPIFNISSASDITIANLTFNEGPDDPACTPYQMNGSEIYPCQSTIEINQSSNILLEQVNILHSKDHAIAFSATQGISIQDSQIQDAGVFGIWAGSTSSNVSITNNLIQDVKSNGIFLSDAQNTTISGNTLKHNHHVALFDTCGGLCPGGQIDMLNNTSLLIYSNQIIDGQIDLNNATGQTGGIEITYQNTNVIITNNEIANNLGIGIGTNPGVTGTNFWISGNKIYNNGINLYLLPGTGIQESGDCFTPP